MMSPICKWACHVIWRLLKAFGASASFFHWIRVGNTDNTVSNLYIFPPPSGQKLIHAALRMTQKTTMVKVIFQTLISIRTGFFVFFETHNAFKHWFTTTAVYWLYGTDFVHLSIYKAVIIMVNYNLCLVPNLCLITLLFGPHARWSLFQYGLWSSDWKMMLITAWNCELL